LVELYYFRSENQVEMSRLFNFFRDQYDGFFKFFIFLFAMVLIVFIFPKDSKFKYEFQKGKPWVHEDLIAPFDFAILKPQEMIAKDMAELTANKRYYFDLDTTAAQEVTENLFQRIKEVSSLSNDSIALKREFLSTKEKIGRIVNLIYQTGVIEIISIIENKDSDYSIEVKKGNEVYTTELENLYTLKSAINKLESNLEDASPAFFQLVINSFGDKVIYNLSYNEETTNIIQEEAAQKLSLTQGLVIKGESVISKGELVDGKKLQMLQSLKQEFETQIGGGNQFLFILLGQSLLVALVLFALALFLMLFRKSIFASDFQLMFLLLLLVLFVLAAKVSIGIELFSIYLVPFCMLPIVVRTFFDTRTALFSHLVLILIVGFIAPNPYEFILIQMITGIVTIFSVLSIRNRGQLFISSGVIFAVYSLCFIGISMVQEGAISSINYDAIAWFFGSAMLTLFAYPLIYVFEKIFGFVSEVTLLEIADTNNKLLRQLNFKAPGTFQHSLQVANLAEEAIRAIGGNALLVRVGALYHDIGKMNSPLYFIENQASHINPHDELSPEESAQIIIQHVKDGIQIAKKHKLPDLIIDFIRTHHGTSSVRFFLTNYQNQNPDIIVDESLFKYPGPIPFSKETSVLMMADSVEAASRSLKTYDIESIDKLVEGIVQNQMAEGQYTNADITLKDISTIKKIFKKKLMNIYHVRVAYPERD
tara:strand:+ start:393 stop:2510 length:2118 start_codon:yes stop_codon:yes gene_type:complete